MKATILTLLCTLWLSPLRAVEYAPWWLVDNSDASAARMANVRRASRIETADGTVRLLAEQNGKLVSYFESKNPATVDQVKQQIHMAPSVCIPVGEGAFVMIEAICSIQIDRKNGTESYVLRGLETELGTVTDTEVIKRIKTCMNAR